MEEVPLFDDCRNLVGAVLGSTQNAGKAPPDFSRDMPVLAVFSLAFFAFNWGLRLFVVAPAVRSLWPMKDGQVVKFCQACMEALFYAGFTILGLLVVPRQEWIWPSEKWWAGFTEGGHELMRPDLRGFYLLYIGRYFQAGISVLLEPKRKDFIAMILHHVVTVAICLISYVYGWNRIGVVIMLLFDPADVPLHCAKLFKYASDASGRRLFQFIADRFFEGFAVIFFITRLVCHSYVCWSASVEGPRVIPNAGGPAGWACIALLYVLLAMQLYWFWLIVQAAIKLSKDGAVDDPRSDDEADSPKNKVTKKSQ